MEKDRQLQENETFKRGKILINRQNKMAEVDGTTVRLAPREIDTLFLLSESVFSTPSRLCSMFYESLGVWVSPESIYVYIYRINRKLSGSIDAGEHQQLGYKIAT